MAEEPDRLRQDIATTRASLTHDVDLLAEKTSPKRAARRRWSAAKEKVMGSSEDARQAAGGAAGSVQDKASQLSDSAGAAAHEVADAVKGAPEVVSRQAQGNPLAAGLIAFGAGLLAATLIPVTDAEQRAGRQLKEHSGDLTDRVKDVASELKDDVSGTVQQAAGQLKETTADAAQATQQQVRSAAQNRPQV